MTGGRRIAALILLAGVMLIDGYDLNAMALAQKYLAPELGLKETDFWVVHSAVLVGLGIGALLIAPLGDRFGRKRIIVTGCLVIAVTTLATALSASIATFAIWRLLTGIALGACLANVSALSSEIAPEGRRSTVMAVVSAGIAIGAMAAGFTAPELVGWGGWEMLFLVPGGIALMLGIGLAFVLPGNKAAADGARPASGTKSGVPLMDLLRPPLAFPLAVFASTYMINAIALYMLVSWTPVVLPNAGFDVDLAVRIQGLLQGAGLFVSIFLAFLLDRWKPGLTLTIGYLLIGVAFLAIWGTPADPLSWSILLLIAGGGITGIHGALMALSPKLFPSTVLSSAIGAAVAISRIGAIAAPPIGAALIDGGVSPAGYFLSLTIPVGLCVLLTLLIPKVIRKDIRA
ncbi:AAHS family 4-hydroxybenzoate transporter-like MFS transporter [Altererythrobacter atlanticus]|uniref:4-hydroxybenzoate transporter PcaK n=1 Tax=Croceibacterium atlanticum TaxID=1267766 RepID=A0A0F7KXH8_9SPHN|nr:MFS transporter [Croceibacterium atlanticum]AKH43907.1 4-hydroxybenzoate transporter PcaK [Croceibacterium atlanticum]MBB5733643.1 AAHS family 4-hydroxybenzoate transporter-like MFS transporter [Croceibacterium atlanticum]